jgi:hypothetical protein
MKKRIKVIWCGNEAFAYYDRPQEAYEQVATLFMAGFRDARIDWDYWRNPKCKTKSP